MKAIPLPENPGDGTHCALADKKANAEIMDSTVRFMSMFFICEAKLNFMRKEVLDQFGKVFIDPMLNNQFPRTAF
jgi:hypothetical protein